MTNLVGRRARGAYWGLNPRFKVDFGDSLQNPKRTWITCEGEVVYAELWSGEYGVSDSRIAIGILDADHQIRLCPHTRVVVLPRDFQGPLR